jgi:hopanoid biosynthesis associated protein HpnK
MRFETQEQPGLKNIVVTADDFGAGVEVNEAVETAHVHGVLKAASLMVGAPFAADAVRRAKAMPSLRVGLHLVLTEGRPLLPPSEVPDLVDASGTFRANMARMGVSLFFNKRARAQLAAEMTAQFEAFRATGLSLDHANAHKHFHLHPTIGAMMLEIGKRYGLRAVRVPLEPADVLAKAEPGYKPVSAWDTAPWAHLLRRRVRAAGMISADSVFGLRWSGAMTRDRLAGIIRNAPQGLIEIYLHPATRAYEGSAPGYRYAEELDALISPETAETVRESSAALGGFADFQ